MGIKHYTLGSSGDFVDFPGLYTLPLAGDAELHLNITQFPGTTGEGHLISGPHGRDLEVEVDLTGYSTYADLQDVINQLAELAGTLMGDLQIDGATFNYCTFVGIRQTQRPFLDGADQGWTCLGIIYRWRQRRI